MFFSADVAGSTAFKAKKSGDRDEGRPGWLPLFEEFFRDFPLQMNRQVSVATDSCSPAEVWKLAGDEILLVREVRRLEGVSQSVQAFRETLRNYQKFIRDKHDKGLGLKGAVWCAGFPVINSEVEIESGRSPDEKIIVARDYIGPSIDAGFRLAKFASPARIVVSPEVAWLISKHNEDSVQVGNIYYDGDAELKGVFGGRPVPIFTIDAGDPLEARRNSLSGREPCKTRDLREFVEQFIGSIDDPNIVTLPYIGEAWGISPEAHRPELERLQQRWDRENAPAPTGGTVELVPPEISIKP